MWPGITFIPYVCPWARARDTCPPVRNSLGTLLASREEEKEEVLEVKAGDLVLQWWLLLQSCGDASGSRLSEVAHRCQNPSWALVVLGGEAGHEAERQIMGRQSALKKKQRVVSVFIIFYRYQSVNSCMLHLLSFAVVNSVLTLLITMHDVLFLMNVITCWQQCYKSCTIFLQEEAVKRWFPATPSNCGSTCNLTWSRLAAFHCSRSALQKGNICVTIPYSPAYQRCPLCPVLPASSNGHHAHMCVYCVCVYLCFFFFFF